MSIMSRPISLILLLICLIFLSISGLFGGIAMLIDPSGQILGLPASLLEPVPIDNFLLPGLFLIVAYGFFSLVVAYGLWRRAGWAWGSTVVLSIILIGWICGQILFWGMPEALQLVYLGLGLLMLLLCLTPSTKEDQQAASTQPA